MYTRRKKTLVLGFIVFALLLAMIGCTPPEGETGTAVTETQAAGDTGAAGGDTGAAGDTGGTDAGGAAPSDQTPETGLPPDSPPDPPGDPSAEHVPIFDVLLSWVDHSNNEDGFHIYRRRVDIPEPPEQIGETGPDETSFLDGTVFCGATYQYIIASFNAAGESPTEVCWQVKMPPCPPTYDASLGDGPDQGFNFLTADQGPGGDLYLALLGGEGSFLADQDGQLGLLDLGDQGETPLTHVPLPPDPVYARDGVPATLGFFYVALARDGMHLIPFSLEQLGDTAELFYTIWSPGAVVEMGPCEGGGSSTSQYQPGGPCVTGDDVCDPTCVPPDDSQIGTRVPQQQPGMPGDCAQYLNDLDAYMDCIYQSAQATAYLTSPVAFTTVAIAVQPTYTDRDYDCADDPCVDGDDICNPICEAGANIPPGAMHECYGNDNFQYCCTDWNLDQAISDYECYPIVDPDCPDDPCVDGDDICEPGCETGGDIPGQIPQECIDQDGDGYVDLCCADWDGNGQFAGDNECYPVLDDDCHDDGDGDGCPCGDGICDPTCENNNTCPKDCPCIDDGVCSPTEGSNCDDCDDGDGCVCGDGICDPACENTDNCPQDCQCTDDGVCGPGEGANCRDCGDTAGGCGNPCADSSQCAAGLSCFEGRCWDSCICGQQCGDCACTRVCVVMDPTGGQCREWGYRDCHGNPCNP